MNMIWFLLRPDYTSELETERLQRAEKDDSTCAHDSSGLVVAVRTYQENTLANLLFSAILRPMRRLLAPAAVLLLVFASSSGKANDPLTNGLVGYYPFDGNADDSSGNRNGIVMGATLATDRFGQPSHAYHFDDSSSGIFLGETDLSNSLTISAWVRKEGNSTTHDQIVCVTNAGGVYLNIFPIQNPSISNHIDFGANYNPNDRYLSPDPIPLNQWIQIVATYDGQNVSLYQDGQLVTTALRTGTFSAGTMWIGRDGPGTATDVFRGFIDDVRLYRRALTATEVALLYELESGPRLQFIKSFTVDFRNLTLGTNYQLQASGDLVTWTNWGSPFTVTNIHYTNTIHHRIDAWDKLHFRLQSVTQ